MTNPFALAGSDNITAEEHFGLKGFMLTAGVPYRDVLSLRGLWAPPYAGTDFVLEGRLRGEKVPTGDYSWHGNECRRQGCLGNLQVKSTVVLHLHRRGGLLKFAVTNTGPQPETVPVQLAVAGAVDYVTHWEFQRPSSAEAGRPWCERAPGWRIDDDGRLVKQTEGGALALATDLDDPTWRVLAGHWEAELRLAPGEARTIRLAFAIGNPKAAAAVASELLQGGETTITEARREWTEQVETLFSRLPRLRAADPRLVSFYHRSLVHLLLNQWRVPDFVLNPYYSTGGINGGCVCCYLWDFGEPWEILSLYDPAAVKAHIKQFLSLDITQHFAFMPITGEAFGPWYPVNQEKIIFLTYYYVMLTGDRDFLQEQVGGKTILDWMLFHATYRDPRQLPVSLIDYGKGNHHLELRGSYRYDNYLPDLNLRRCANLRAAYELSRLAGHPAEELLRRAGELQDLVKRLMWSPQHRWFYHLDENFNPHLRYTVQMFKPLAGEALDREEEKGLLSHLNEREFISAYGLHSMSKLDPAYDQADIDNGGGGNYTAFTPQIIERLYKLGRVEMAENLLARILWWGERMPYWGDSIVANNIDYRRDTPLQNTIGALAGAQCLIFGMFGVAVTPDGSIAIDPHPPSFSPQIALQGLRVRGRCIDITLEDGQYTVTSDGLTRTAPVGTPTTLAAG